MDDFHSGDALPLILVIEDSDIIRKTFAMQIQKMGVYRVEEAADLASARSFLNAHPEGLSLILLDLMLPDGDGRELLDECRADPDLADVPVLIITATTKPDTLEDCLRRGAVDYLKKPCPRYEMELRINGAVERYQTLLRLKCLTDQLRHAALHDPLTDIFNRRAIFDELNREISSAKRYGTPLCFCLADLDHFKSVNDTHGHQVGDEVLRRSAVVLKESLRDTDIVGRYGGEEFGVVLPNTELVAAAACLERTREALRDIVFHASGGGTFTVTATFGVAQLAGLEETDDMLVERADRALYAGKEAGRDRVCTAADNPIP